MAFEPPKNIQRRDRIMWYFKPPGELASSSSRGQVLHVFFFRYSRDGWSVRYTVSTEQAGRIGPAVQCPQFSPARPSPAGSS